MNTETLRYNLNHLIGFKGKLTAGEQRILFGKAIFGRKDIRIKPNSLVVVEMVAFGQDANHYYYSFDEVENLLSGQRKEHWMPKAFRPS